MERREVKSHHAFYVCPVCGYSETIKLKEKPSIRGIEIEIEEKGEGVIEEHRRKIHISEEEIENVLEILEGTEASS